MYWFEKKKHLGQKETMGFFSFRWVLKYLSVWGDWTYANDLRSYYSLVKFKTERSTKTMPVAMWSSAMQICPTT